MNTQVDWKLVGAFADAIEIAHKNGTCLYPGCTDKPIGSHVIARKTLKLIAENSKVFTWNMPDAWAMYRQFNASKPMIDLSLVPDLVGIHDIKKVTYPLFCQDHDYRNFAPIEKDEIASSSVLLAEQIVLLAYRALCSVTYNDTLTEVLLEVSKQIGYTHPLNDPAKYEKASPISGERYSLEGTTTV